MRTQNEIEIYDANYIKINVIKINPNEFIAFKIITDKIYQYIIILQNSMQKPFVCFRFASASTDL